MTDQLPRPDRPRSSRRRYLQFVEDYRRNRLDDLLDAENKPKGVAVPAAGAAVDGATAPAVVALSKAERRAKHRQYVREYLGWLWPHRFAVAGFVLLALTRAGLEMIEPLFMRFMVD